MEHNTWKMLLRSVSVLPDINGGYGWQKKENEYELNLYFFIIKIAGFGSTIGSARCSK